MSGSLGFYKKFLGYSNEELVELAKADEDALDYIIFKNTGLVKAMAGKYIRHISSSAIDIDDLYQEGRIALFSAVKSFNPNGNGKFSSYAGNLIKWRIMRYIADNGSLVQLPVYLQEEIRKITAEFARLGLTDYDSPEAIALVAKSLGVKPDQVQSRLEARNSRNSLSIDAPVSDESASTLAEFIADVNSTPEEYFARIDANKAIIKIIDSTLSPREADIIKRLFGLAGFERETLESIGKSYGISKARVHSIKTKCFAKLSKVPGFRDLF